MGKIELQTSQQYDIVAAVMRKLEKQGLTFDFNAKLLPGTVENELVVTLQLVTSKGQVPLDDLINVKKELPKFTVNGSFGRTIFLYIRGSKEAFLELVQQQRPAVLGSPHTPTPSGSPLPTNQRPLADHQKINDYGHEDRH